MDILLHLEFTPPWTRPAQNRHVGVGVKQIQRVRAYLEQQGAEILEALAVPHRERFYLLDPFGSYFEFIEIKGQKQTQVAAQRRLIFPQALGCRFGVNQNGLCVRQKTLSGLGQAHPVRIAPQESCATLLLQQPKMTAQSRLGNFQAARAGRNAAALHDANKEGRFCIGITTDLEQPLSGVLNTSLPCARLA